MTTASLPIDLCARLDRRATELGVTRRFVIRNPATGEPLAELPDLGAAGARWAVDVAAQEAANVPSIEQRRQWLSVIEQTLLDRRESLGRLITLENGKPLPEAVAEVVYAAGFFGAAAACCPELAEATLAERARGCAWRVRRRPAGVAALITPWNFPVAMMAKKLSGALAAGCAVVMKPAEQTPLSLLVAIEAMLEAGVPAERLGVVVGRPEPIGRVLCSHPAVRIVSFTGSTEVGRWLMAETAPHVKRLALELGGNAPFIVFQDADLAAAADALVANKFRAGGQTCVCANRVFVHEAIHDAFLDHLRPKLEALRVGDGLEEGVDLGPLIDRKGWEKVDRHVRDAVARGARLLLGGDAPRPTQEWGAFYPPTLLTGIQPEMAVCQEETFGPVVAIASFRDEPAVLEAANAGIHGLAAYLFTRDPARAERVVDQLTFGHVGVNTGTGPAPHAPFGGMKQSGFGREGGLDGILEFTDTQVVATADA
ncbi:MAG: aldehyde dehydrogenase family protein [Phycisphaeraceae bacterium]